MRKKWPNLEEIANNTQICEKSTQVCSINLRKNNVQFDFTMSGGPRPLSRKFRHNYKKAAKAINAKDLVASKTLLDEMASKPRKSFNEENLLWQLKGHYYRLTGDTDQELISFKRSISTSHGDSISSAVMLAALENIFRLQLQKNLLSGALKTYKSITKVKKNDEIVARVDPYKNKIDQLIASDKPLVAAQKVGARGFAQYDLARNSFQFHNVKGDLSKLTINCDKQRKEFEFSTSNTWTIPASWGQCSVYVYGNSDSSFNIIELPGKA